MRNVFLLMIFLGAVACGSSEENNFGSAGLTFSIDTVMVDPGEEILYLKTGLYHSVVSEDERYLLNFNSDSYRMEKIDLDELRAISFHSFEKEGPNGIGSLYRVYRMPGDEYLMLSYYGGGVFNLDGEKQQTIKFGPDHLSGDELKINEMLFSGALSEKHPGQLYGAFSDFREETFFFGVVDMDQKTFKKWELPEQEYQKEYFFRMVNEKGLPRVIMGPNYFVNYVSDRIYISNSVDNSIHVYHPEEKSMDRYVIDHQLFPQRKTGKYPKSTESEEKFREVTREYHKEINYQQPVWDAANERFYRFSYQTDIQNDAEGKEKRVSRVYLSAFDADLNLLGETEVADYRKQPGVHFVKDGQIWMFENVEDELGFVRFRVK
jgi:hypothetical protein